MFVIVYQNSVILGPMRWNRFRFENQILEETEVQITLADRNDNKDPVLINNDLKILPVVGTQNPSFNSKIQFLNGPYWVFTDTEATMSFVAEDKNVEAVKNELKTLVASERYLKEIAGTKVTVQNVEVTVETDRETRNVFVQKFTLMGENDTVNWKFPEGWLNLTKSDLGTVVAAGVAYIQSQFDWELTKVSEIDNCTTLSELDAIVILEEVNV